MWETGCKSPNMCPESKTNGKIRCEPSLRLKKNMLEASAVIPII